MPACLASQRALPLLVSYHFETSIQYLFICLLLLVALFTCFLLPLPSYYIQRKEMVSIAHLTNWSHLSWNKQKRTLFLVYSGLQWDSLIDFFSMSELRDELTKDDEERRLETQEGVKSQLGYGGKFGIEKDRMDKSAVGHDYIAKVRMGYALLLLYVLIISGEFTSKQNSELLKCELNVSVFLQLEKHASQKDYSAGFGGRYGVQKNLKDKVSLLV